MSMTKDEYEENKKDLASRIHPFIEDVFNFSGFISMLGEEVSEDGGNYQDDFVGLLVQELQQLTDPQMLEMFNFFNLLNLRIEEIQAKRTEEREVGYEERRIAEQEKSLAHKARFEALKAEQELLQQDDQVVN